MTRSSFALPTLPALPIWIGLSAALLLGGCASNPGERNASATPSRAAAEGQVLGRNDRLLVYRPAAGETLPQIAQRFLGDAKRDWVIGDFNQIDRPQAGVPLVVPLKALQPLGVYDDRYQTVPILCYHRFSVNGGNKMSVSGAAFAAQLDWLAANGYHVLPLSSLEDWLAGRSALPLKSVVITADDGYESFYRFAFPQLQRHGFPATLFVYTDFVGAPDAVSWPQLQEMTASGLVDVQPHSRTHRNLIERQADETEARYQQALVNEVQEPSALLARKLDHPQHLYAYPYGDTNAAVLKVLTNQHFDLAVTVTPGGNPFFAQPYMLRRTMIFGDMSLDDFKARLQISRALDAR